MPTSLQWRQSIRRATLSSFFLENGICCRICSSHWSADFCYSEQSVWLSLGLVTSLFHHYGERYPKRSVFQVRTAMISGKAAGCFLRMGYDVEIFEPSSLKSRISILSVVDCGSTPWLTHSRNVKRQLNTYFDIWLGHRHQYWSSRTCHATAKLREY